MQIALFEMDVEEKVHKLFVNDLKRGSGFEDGKKRIHDLFKRNLTKFETIKLLKDEYGIGGRSTLAYPEGYRQGHGTKGIEITIGTGEEKQFTWSQVYDELFNLIETGEYLEDEE